MVIHDVKQGSDEWKKLRSGMITATDTACLMVIPEDGSMWGQGAKTYIKKKAIELASGSVPDSIKTDAMEWGNTCEEVARNKYEEITGDNVALVGFVEFEDGIGCSPDGFIRGDMLVEIKCPYNQDILKGYIEKDGAPKKYLLQMLHQMVTTGRDICAFFAYDPRTDKSFLKVYNIGGIEDLLGYTLTEYFVRVRAARDTIKLCAEAIQLAKSEEPTHVCACKSQVLALSEFDEFTPEEEKMPWE